MISLKDTRKKKKKNICRRKPRKPNTSRVAEWKAVEQAVGKTGSLQPGSVFKIGLPRTDLKVTVRGVSINPVLALGSWIAFKKMGNDAVVMGDLVLTEDEVGP